MRKARRRATMYPGLQSGYMISTLMHKKCLCSACAARMSCLHTESSESVVQCGLFPSDAAFNKTD